MKNVKNHFLFNLSNILRMCKKLVRSRPVEDFIITFLRVDLQYNKKINNKLRYKK